MEVKLKSSQKMKSRLRYFTEIKSMTRWARYEQAKKTYDIMNGSPLEKIGALRHSQGLTFKERTTSSGFT